jgi:hypothetical protein
VDLVAWQVLEPHPRGVAKVELHVLDDEEVIRRSPGVAGKSVVLEPYTGVGVPVVPGYVGRSSETRGEPRISDALAKGPRTPLVQRPAAVTVIVTVVMPSASSVVVVV